jgi:hypothetical protein
MSLSRRSLFIKWKSFHYVVQVKILIRNFQQSVIQHSYSFSLLHFVEVVFVLLYQKLSSRYHAITFQTSFNPLSITAKFPRTKSYHYFKDEFDNLVRTLQLFLFNSTLLIVALFFQPSLAYKWFAPQYTS